MYCKEYKTNTQIIQILHQKNITQYQMYNQNTTYNNHIKTTAHTTKLQPKYNTIRK